MQKRLPKPFRGLRWKLTLSYTLVTVAALAVVLVIVMASAWFVISNSKLVHIAILSIVRSFVLPPVTSYLDKPEPDLQGLENWLQSAATPDGFAFQSPDYSNIRVTLGDSKGKMTLIVLDENLDYLAGIPEPGENALNTLLIEDGSVLAAAQTGEGKLEHISRISSDKTLTIALPVTGKTGVLQGVVVFKIVNPVRGFLIQVFSLMGGSVIVFTLAAGVLGAIFGYFTARGLTRRLQDITQTADGWSKGDFSIFIRDRSDDELGQMASHLNRMAEQLQNLLHTRQELATLEERNRLARDLHDSVKQQVFATIMQVGAAQAVIEEDPSVAREHLNEAEQLARQAQSELTILIRELRPGTLEGKGLGQALKEYVADWSRQNQIATEVRVLGGELPLPLDLQQTLFRVTQEALSNIARHSEATQVEIQLAVKNDEVRLTITDNGKGFDISAVERKGVGLRSMRERLETVGGGLRLESTPGRGTVLAARCQVSEEVPE